MNCPKCGFAQEQRSDCKKCGVVFSKYYALYPSTKPAPSGGVEDPIEKELIERERDNAISDMQLQIRELNARFEEIESEKTIQDQLRTDMENLQRLLQESLDLTSSRLAEFEKQIEKIVVEPTKTSGEDDGGGDHSARISELQNQFLELRDQFREMQSLFERLQQNHPAEEPQDVLQNDVHAIRKNLDQLFSLMNKRADQQT